VNAHYGGDGVYAPSDSNDVTVSGVTKTASSATTFLLNTLLGTFPPQSGTVISPAGVILTAQIAGNNPNNIGGGPVATGTVDFLDNGTVVATAVPLNQTGEAFHATPVIFTAGDHSIVAHYNGDASYNPSDSAAVPFTVAAPAFNLTAAPATVTAGATGPSVVTITPTNAFTGTVAVSCSGTLPPGVTCAPANINVTNGAVATGNLNLTVAGPSTTLTASAFPVRSESLPAHHSGWMFASATTGFFAVLLLFLPGRKRLRAVLSLGLVSLLSLAIGCNSSSNQNSGPAASTTKLTVTSSKVPSTNANGFQVTVNVTGGSVTPSGQVQIFDQTTNTTAPPVALTNGSANINLTLTVGTHTVIAQYLGDSKHNTSQSGALNLTTTGTAQITITANPVANGPASVALTIN
ncbi:MAG TPA: Ig-like domain-containing protein, partial [Candidatus Acidoferrales bacterium]|nr:Ig-like domain-containing protein [Candidatus Acidoferrales bacterium]